MLCLTYRKNQINISTSATAQISINKGKDVFYELNFAAAGAYDIQLTPNHSINYQIYDENFDVVLSGCGTAIKRCLAAAAGTYYLRMDCTDKTVTGAVSAAISAHTHLYTDNHVWQTDMAHRSYCICGSYTTSAHVVAQDSLSGTEQYAICLLCRGQAYIGMVTGPTAGNGLPHTQNGSYILPNGVIVLVNEDIAAYMAGELVFYSGETE